MRRLLIPACAAMLCGAAQAQSSTVTVYGRLNVGLESFQAPGGDVTRLSNYRSVLGFRGDEALGDRLHAIFQIEGTLSPDTGAGSPAARDTRVGLSGGFGAIFAGNWTLPYNSATASLDPFYPTTAGYMSIMGNGSAATVDNVSDTSSFDRRQQNSVHWNSADWKGWSVRLAQGLSEERPANGAHPSLTSGALIYERGPLYFTLAHERHHEYQGVGLNDSGSKAGAAWQFGATRVAAIAERLRYQTASGTLARNSWYLSTTHQWGASRLLLAYARAGDGKGGAKQRIGYIAAGPDTGASHATLGYDYAFSRRTSLFAFYTRLRNDAHGHYDFGTNTLGAQEGAAQKGVSLGMRHAF
ncbi:porin [Oxalobacteraceae bacterium A2-2]